MFCKKRKLCLFWKEDLLGWYNPTRAISSPVFPQGDQRPSIFINISKSKDKNDRQIPKWNENTNKTWKRNLFLLIPAEIEFKEELVRYRCVGSKSSFEASVLCNRRLDRKNSGAQVPSGGIYHLNSLCWACFLFFHLIVSNLFSVTCLMWKSLECVLGLGCVQFLTSFYHFLPWAATRTADAFLIFQAFPPSGFGSAGSTTVSMLLILCLEMHVCATVPKLG